MSLNNEHSEDKMSISTKTACLRKFSDLNSACLKEIVHVKIFQLQNMLNESERYLDATNGLYVLRGLAFCRLYRRSVITNLTEFNITL